MKIQDYSLQYLNRRIIRKISYFLIIFCVTYLILIPQTNNFCHQITGLDFDTQNLFVWDHLAEMGYKPYKDTFYPYGFLFFYKSQSMPWFIIYSLIGTTLLVIIYYTIINKLFNKGYIKLVIYLSLLLLILNTLGTWTFTRYGFSLSVSLLSCWILFYAQKRKLSITVLGLIAGFSAIISSSDTLYIVLTQIILILFDEISNPKMKGRLIKLLRNLIVKSLYYLIGIIIGLVPLTFYLTSQEMIKPFIQFYQDLLFISEYAKAPYLINNFYEIYIIVTLIICFAALALRLGSSVTRNKYRTYILMTTFLSFLIIMQKHLIRPMSIIIIYNAFIANLILFGISQKEMSHLFRKINKSVLILLLYIIFYLSLTTSFNFPFNYSILDTSILAYQRTNLKNTINFNNKLCRISEINWQRLQLPESYSQIKNFLGNEYYPHQFFSFPYDPILYLLTNNQPAPYPNVYESAPMAIQKKNIDYIEQHQIPFIIYNLKALAIDGSPDYMRGSETMKYIIANYHPIKYIEPFVVLARNTDSNDFFSKTNQKEYPLLYSHLLNPIWGSFSGSHGKQIEKTLLEFANYRGFYSNTFELNDALKLNSIDSKNLFLLLNFNLPSPTVANVIIINEKNDQTSIAINIKKDIPNAISFSTIPLFMNGGKVKSIDISPQPESIWLLNNNSIINTWR